MIKSDFERLCKEYGTEYEYSDEFEIYLLKVGETRSTPFSLESLQDFTREEFEQFLSRVALSRLMEGGR